MIAVARGDSVGITPLQIALPLEPGVAAATPPPCCCCRGHRWLGASTGWTSCTWCDGTGIDPDSELFAVLTGAGAGPGTATCAAPIARTDASAAPARPRRAA